ncbi:MAG: hypothetical protein CL920_19420 [Deltaproteobacteria bacterium]|nr:hypothetical protein [Deltaproteobacteria bacterium]MBU50858.1 hypothetical protein [Deltaproteobacteria bacterium]
MDVVATNVQVPGVVESGHSQYGHFLEKRPQTSFFSRCPFYTPPPFLPSPPSIVLKCPRLSQGQPTTSTPRQKARDMRSIVTRLSLITLLTTLCLHTQLACVAGHDWFTLPIRANNILIIDQTGYVSMNTQGLSVINMVDGSTFTQLAPDQSKGIASTDLIAHVGNTLIALDAYAPGNISTYDMSTPSAPTATGSVRTLTLDRFTHLHTTSSRLAVAGGTGPVKIWDVDSAGALKTLATISSSNEQNVVHLSEKKDQIYIFGPLATNSFGLRIVALPPTESAPKEVSQLAIDGAGNTKGSILPVHLAVSAHEVEDTLLVAFAKGLAIIDVKDPTTPTLLKTLDLKLQATAMTVYGKKAYVVGTASTPTLVTIDISAPSAPTILEESTLPSNCKPVSVTVSDQYIAIAGHDTGLYMKRIVH